MTPRVLQTSCVCFFFPYSLSFAFIVDMASSGHFIPSLHTHTYIRTKHPKIKEKIKLELKWKDLSALDVRGIWVRGGLVSIVLNSSLVLPGSA